MLGDLAVCVAGHRALKNQLTPPTSIEKSNAPPTSLALRQGGIDLCLLFCLDVRVLTVCQLMGFP